MDDDAAEAFARRFCLYGTADEVAARLTELGRSGVAAVLLQHVGSYDLPRHLVVDFADQVLPVRLASKSAGLMSERMVPAC